MRINGKEREKRRKCPNPIRRNNGGLEAANGSSSLKLETLNALANLVAKICIIGFETIVSLLIFIFSNTMKRSPFFPSRSAFAFKVPKLDFLKLKLFFLSLYHTQIHIHSISHTYTQTHTHTHIHSLHHIFSREIPLLT